jgi:hypothetical protein
MLTSRSFIHDIFQAGAVIEVNAGPEAAATEGGKCYFFLPRRLGGPIELESQGGDDELVQGDSAV